MRRGGCMWMLWEDGPLKPRVGWKKLGEATPIKDMIARASVPQELLRVNSNQSLVVKG